MKKTSQLLAATVLVLSFVSQSCAQRFRYGVNASYTSTKYSFPVSSDAYHEADIEPFTAPKAGASVQLLVSDVFRIGTGVQYVAFSGTKSGGRIKGDLANPNSSGELTFKADNSFIVFPVEFTLVFAEGKKIRPTVSAGGNFHSLIKQEMLVTVTPTTVNPYYESVQTEMNKSQPHDFFGFFLGGGVTVPVSRHEFSLMLNYRMNTCRFEVRNASRGDSEKHEMKFNMLDFTLGYSIR